MPVIASGAGVHTEAIADMLTIFTQKMRHLVFFNTAKTASVYLFNFFSSTVLRNRKSPVYSCAKEIVVLFNRETVLECKHLKEALYSLFNNIANNYNMRPKRGTPLRSQGHLLSRYQVTRSLIFTKMDTTQHRSQVGFLN